MPVAVRAGRAVPAVAAICAVAGLAAVLEPNTFPSYDYAFALASGQDILAGRETGYVVPVYSPVPHPLTLAEAMLVVKLGDTAFAIFSAFTLTMFGLMLWSLFNIGRTLVSWPVGLLAAAAVFTAPAIFELAVRTYGDVVAASFVVTATMLEVTKPRRGRPVLAVLALAGLLRPEAWLLSGLYWLYLFRDDPWRERATNAALVAIGPVVWAIQDYALTGDPLHSVEVTRVYTQKADVSVTPGSLWTAVESISGLPIVLGALAGAVAAFRMAGYRALAPLLAGGILFCTTVGPALLGESPVLRRYLVVSGAVLAIFWAIACLGWTKGPGPFGTRRIAWAVGGSALLALTIVHLAPQRADRWDLHRARQQGRVELLEHLRAWVRTPAPNAFLTEPVCAPILTPGYGYRPYLRLWLDIPPKDVAFHFEDVTPPDGLVLLPTGRDGFQRLMLVDVGQRTREALLSAQPFRERFELVARSDRWELYAGPRCRAAAAPRPA